MSDLAKHSWKYNFKHLIKPLDIEANDDIKSFLSRIKDYRDWIVELKQDRNYHSVIKCRSIDGQDIEIGIIKLV